MFCQHNKKILVIYIKFPSVSPLVCHIFYHDKNINNSAIFQHKMLPMVANERYCYIFLIFRGIWDKGGKWGPKGVIKKNKKKPKKCDNFFAPKIFVHPIFFCDLIFKVIWGNGVPREVLKK